MYVLYRNADDLESSNDPQNHSVFTFSVFLHISRTSKARISNVGAD